MKSLDYAAQCEVLFFQQLQNLGLYSLSGKTSYRKISCSLEAARFGFKLFQSLWNLAGTSAAAPPRCLSYFRSILPLQNPISRLRDFPRFGGKTSYRLMNRGPGSSLDSIAIPDSKVYGPNMGPIWDRQDPGGPHVGPMNFVIWDYVDTKSSGFETMWDVTIRRPITYCNSDLDIIYFASVDAEQQLKPAKTIHVRK